MKIGAENRTKVFAAAGLMVFAIAMVVRIVIGSGDPVPTVVTPIADSSLNVRTAPTRPTRSTARTKGVRKLAAAPRSIDPTLRFDWLKGSEDTQYAGNGRNIFMAQAEIPQPIAPGVTDAEKKAAEGPPPTPPPPPINLKFYGFASKPGEPKRVFLSQGEDVFIATEGEIIDRRYKVVRISPMSVEIEDVLYNNRQSIPLTQG